MSDDVYRWAVTVRRTDLVASSSRPFVRQVETAGPNPDCAAKRAQIMPGVRRAPDLDRGER